MLSTPNLLPHMRHVQATERDLRELGLVWQTIESASAISCPEEVASILPTLTRARARFGALQGLLIDTLAAECRAELGDELSARARCTIDILIRNLFERTADVGFLATDDLIRSFCAATADERDHRRDALRERLAEYQAKYTVYEDVVVLSSEGEVLVRLDTKAQRSHSQTPLLNAVRETDGFREYFGQTDLVESGAPALLYAHRITHADGRLLGTLVLVFRFEDELRRIFEDMADDRGQTAIVLLDEGRRVIATSDEAHIPLGARLPRLDEDEVSLTTFSGREYMAVCCATHGYQGYRGLPWRAQAMVSLLTAFRPRDVELPSIEVAIDHSGVQQIQGDVDEINRELRRVVWNGRLTASSHPGDALRLKAVLNEVSAAGARTRTRVDAAVRDLQRNALSRVRHQARDLARLAADILDRNLYERANDCRWWALAPAVIERLAEPASEMGSARLNAVLDRLNALYTVYSRVVVFDAEGEVRGVSRADVAPGLIGRSVESYWLESVRRLTGRQHYAVTPFAATDFHDQGETYVYLAAIREPGGSALLGGIALLFNSAVEFNAMLTEIIKGQEGVAAFVDAQGRCLAASDPALAAVLLSRSEGDLSVIEHAGGVYACARFLAPGYREFKREDGYVNGAAAVVALRMGAAQVPRDRMAEEFLRSDALRGREDRIELAVVQVGSDRFAFPVHQVLQALPCRGVVRTPTALKNALGLLELINEGRPGLIQVLCARQWLGLPPAIHIEEGAVLVLATAGNSGQPLLGLRVDDVQSVVEVDPRRIQPAPRGSSSRSWVTGIVDAELAAPPDQVARRALLQIIDAVAIRDAALGPGWTPRVAVSHPDAA